jgi:hypothetical protein
MEWWHVLLIILGAVGGGILSGFLVSYLFRLWGKKREPPFQQALARRQEVNSFYEGREPAPRSMPAAEKPVDVAAAHSGVEDKGAKKAFYMIPVLSPKSIKVLLIGVIIGSAMGVGYWFVSPALAEMSESVNTEEISASQEGPFAAILNVRVTNRGTDYIPIKELQRTGEYYAAKMNSPHFFEFLSEEIAKRAPQYSHTPEELEQTTRIRYNYNTETPDIEIRATSPADDEAFFVTSSVTSIFKDYLLAEQRKIGMDEYERKTRERERTTAALSAAEKELARLTINNEAYDIRGDPAYVELEAQIVALEDELHSRAARLATLVAEGNSGQDYLAAKQAVEKTSSALSKAKSDLSILEAQATIEHLEEILLYSRASAEVERLESELDRLNQSLSIGSPSNTDTLESTDALGIFSLQPVGVPAIVPIPPERVRGRNALMMGAIVGIGGAWLLLNRRWLASGMPASPTTGRREEAEDDEE